MCGQTLRSSPGPSNPAIAEHAVPPPVRPAVSRTTFRELVSPMPYRLDRVLLSAASVALIVTVWLLEVTTGGRYAEVADFGYIPVAVAGFVWGIPGGVVAAGFASRLLMGSLSPPEPANHDRWIATIVFLIIGILAGLAGRIRYQRMGHVSDLANRLTNVYSNSLLISARALEIRDVDTAGHSDRVAQNALAVGQHLQLSENEQITLFWAALLHDIGKIAVPEAILHKSEPLTEAEWTVMKSHAAIGASLIEQASPEFADLASTVRSHHEHWDGNGYPNRLQGEAIPRLARLLTVVDVYDALTSPRPYRPAKSSTEALNHLLDRRGTQFDPAAVDAMFDIYIDGALGSPVATPTRPPSYAN